MSIAAAVAFAVALALVYFDGYQDDRGAYESGELFGVACRWVGIGLVVGLLANLWLKRRALGSASWSEVMTPVPFLAGSILSLGLALGFGAPLTERDEYTEAVEECSVETTSPIESLPDDEVRELGREELERLVPGGEPPGLNKAGYFLTSGEGGRAFIVVIPGNDSDDAREQSRAGFLDGIANGSGATPVEDDLPGDAVLLRRSDGVYIGYGDRGCNSFGVFASRQVVETRVQQLSGAAE